MQTTLKPAKTAREARELLRISSPKIDEHALVATLDGLIDKAASKGQNYIALLTRDMFEKSPTRQQNVETWIRDSELRQRIQDAYTSAGYEAKSEHWRIYVSWE